jgi:hypothetical protein
MESDQVLKLLEELGQDEIISKFKTVSPQEQKDFITQINKLDKACRGGIKGYLQRAKILLQNSQKKINFFQDFTIEIPEEIPHIKVGTKEFYELEMASAGIMRGYIINPCTMYFTMDRKIERFLQTSLRIYKVPEERIEEVVNFISEFNMEELANQVLSTLYEYIINRT